MLTPLHVQMLLHYFGDRVMVRDTVFFDEAQAVSALECQRGGQLSIRSIVVQNPKGRVRMTPPYLTASHDDMRYMIRAAHDNFYKPMYVINVRAK